MAACCRRKAPSFWGAGRPYNSPQRR
jgi:hypothetical protein